MDYSGLNSYIYMLHNVTPYVALIHSNCVLKTSGTQSIPYASLISLYGDA